MGCEAGQCNKTHTLSDIIIVTLSLEEWLTKDEEAPSFHEESSILLQCQ